MAPMLTARIVPEARISEHVAMRYFLRPLGVLLLGVRDGSHGPPGRLLDEAEDAHAVDVDDRAAEPAAQGQQPEADERQDERAGSDFLVDVAAVAGYRRD